MNSFFNEDTKEEEKLLLNILKHKSDKLPNIIEEITTSHLIKKIAKNQTNVNIKNENNEQGHKDEKNNDSNVTDIYTSEDKINFYIEANVFSFHIKKNERVNADVYFIPYHNKNDNDVITEYTYNYGYYDIYSENVPKVNKCIHSNKRKSIENDEFSILNKKIKIKKESNENKNEEESIYSNTHELKKKNFQKLLVHFRGRLFIGNHIHFSFFKIKTYLAMLQNDDDSNESKAEDLNYVNKKIQTYNLVKNATYWKQDQYPDISDQNIQTKLFFLIIPSLNNYDFEREIDESVVF